MNSALEFLAQVLLVAVLLVLSVVYAGCLAVLAVIAMGALVIVAAVTVCDEAWRAARTIVFRLGQRAR
jgi:hypothetical protein